MLLVGGAWPLLVELTPAADRPWVSGTSDNSVLSLIFEYNGLGRVDGQTGGPAGTASTMFGGTAGPLRLLNSALGGQAGWLLGFALASGLGLLAIDSPATQATPRTGWLLAVGGALATTAVLFSFAGGIFHPYYVSLLAPFVAALVGAGAAQMLRGGRGARVLAALAVAGVVVELVVRANYPGQLTWLPALLIVIGVLAVVALLAFSSRAVRLTAVGAVLAALLAAPAAWAFDTLGHATSATFPAGGPASVEAGGPGGPGGGFGGARGAGGPGGAFAGPGGAGGGPRGFGAGADPAALPARSGLLAQVPARSVKARGCSARGQPEQVPSPAAGAARVAPAERSALRSAVA